MLVGRDREQRQIERVLERARSGASSSLALLGEPGIGKTVLLDHAAERADGMQLLRARGIESEARIPFASLLELIRPALGMVELIPGPQATTDRPAVAEATYREAIELARESGQRTERPPSSSARRRSNTTSATCTSSSGSTLARNLSRRSLPVRSRRLGAQCPPSGSHNAPA